MITKRQKLMVGGVFTLLLLLSVAGAVFAYASSGVTPMLIHDSSPELSSKVSDEERHRILEMTRSAIFQISLIVIFLSAVWAAFSGSVIWLWSRSSGSHSDEARDTQRK